MIRKWGKRVGAGALAALAVVAAGAGPAGAATMPVVPDNGSWQTNGVVWAIAYVGNDVLLGGEFTTVRPPGAKPGTKEHPAPHLVALNKITGVPDPAFDAAAAGADGTVFTFTPSPDGSKLYVGGQFQHILGQSRTNLAVLDVSSSSASNWSISSTWAKSVGGASSNVRKIVTSPDGGTLYLGGTFSTVGSTQRKYLAALDAGTGNVLPWRSGGTMDRSVRTLVYVPLAGGDRIYVGGYFTTVDGVTQHWYTAVDATGAGALQAVPIAKNQFFNCAAGGSYVADIVTDGSTVVLGIGGYRKILSGAGAGNHCWEGFYAINATDGTFAWTSLADGDVQAMSVVNGTIYGSGHFKNAEDATGACGSGAGTFLPRGHLVAVSFSGVLDCNWNPQMNGVKGGWSSGTDGSRLAFGGEFDQVAWTVNHTKHQGFIQFSS